MSDIDATSLDDIPFDLIDEANIAEEARQAERHDLAQELHDTVIQPLTTLVMSFDSIRYQPLSEGMLEAFLGAWRELAQEALDSLRSALMGLRVHPHAQWGLPDALCHFLAPQVRSCGVRLAIECHEWPVDVPLDWTSSLYLTLREALTNVEKHAHASEVTVLLRGDEEQLRIIVSDDGVGFAQHQASYVRPPRLTTGLGLDGMRDRVTKLNGQLAIMTSPGGGTQLEIHIPYSQPHEVSMVAKPESQRLEAGHYH